ncbi:hypothetical protein K432DRAFT_5293 [Lepidopterella palustris CBS 459.81]|uniref:F-box domain-containing protein n=1 Tax=Lepidopterella palustris CBS 459.81 TaxID=1314670 RepID=A0A8E2JGJ4_9PEZI|nr:hypothetical protein K432DRAFT_5293 [Lepidopterella palustris CBS 459.81]
MAAPIEAFEKLALSTPKIPALHEVSREINTTTSHDLHRESSLMNAKRLDYLAALPVELILMIFSYLDPTAPFLYQSVSRKWRAVLSSPQVLEDALAQWYSAADPPMQFENASGPHSEHEIIYLKLERMQRFRNAKPSSHTVFQTSISLDSVSNDSHITNLIDIIDVAFYGNHVAWIHKSGPVYVVNLRTGANFVVPVEVGGPLGPVWRIYLTNQLLVLQYSIGKGFYAYDLATQEVRSFQVPSKTNIHVAAHGKLVSVLFYPVRAEIPGHADINRAVIVWDFETQTSQSFQITQTVLHMPPHCHPEHQQRLARYL